LVQEQVPGRTADESPEPEGPEPGGEELEDRLRRTIDTLDAEGHTDEANAVAEALMRLYKGPKFKSRGVIVPRFKGGRVRKEHPDHEEAEH
jgi:hypothetical protein